MRDSYQASDRQAVSDVVPPLDGSKMDRRRISQIRIKIQVQIDEKYNIDPSGRGPVHCRRQIRCDIRYSQYEPSFNASPGLTPLQRLSSVARRRLAGRPSGDFKAARRHRSYDVAMASPAVYWPGGTPVGAVRVSSDVRAAHDRGYTMPWGRDIPADDAGGARGTPVTRHS